MRTDLAAPQSRLARRGFVAYVTTWAAWRPELAGAAKDCFLDCSQNCNRVAPRSAKYCEQSCGEYCAQTDRADGLSGSVSNDNAEVGWLSGFDIKAKLTGSAPAGVVYGDDAPPALPDVFGVGPALRSAVTGGVQPDGHARSDSAKVSSLPAASLRPEIEL